MYLSKTPRLLKWLYPSLTWHLSRTDKCVYLTFDDGPIPIVTPHVINILNRFNAKATFFCIGENVEKFPEIYAEVLSNGHRVGNHTYNHLKGWAHSTETYLQNIRKCTEVVNSDLFRPPYGRIKRSQIKAIKKQYPDMRIIMWDVLSADYDQSIDPGRCIQNVLDHAENGSIIVFHDSQKAFPRLRDALPQVLGDLQKRGFEFRLL